MEDLTVEGQPALFVGDVHVELGADQQRLFLNENLFFELYDRKVLPLVFVILIGLYMRVYLVGGRLFFLFLLFWLVSLLDLFLALNLDGVLMVILLVKVKLQRLRSILDEVSFAENELLLIWDGEEMDHADGGLVAQGDVELLLRLDVLGEELYLLHGCKHTFAAPHGLRCAGEAPLDLI